MYEELKADLDKIYLHIKRLCASALVYNLPGVISDEIETLEEISTESIKHAEEIIDKMKCEADNRISVKVDEGPSNNDLTLMYLKGYITGVNELKKSIEQL